MKKIYILCILLICSVLRSFAQGGPVSFAFAEGDSLTRSMPFNLVIGFEDTVTTHIRIDTTASHLWQIGNSSKSFFTHDSLFNRGIATDTANPYPVNANDWFTLKIDTLPTGPIITVWHRYQTAFKHDGGVIEFSSDSGASWENIAYCNSFLLNYTGALLDTLATGDVAFTGNCDSEQMLTININNCFSEKGTSTSCLLYPLTSLFLRFRFISDSVPDSLPGWKIDRIQIENTGCTSAVANVNKVSALLISPNPSPYGVFDFPALDEQEQYTIVVFNEMGQPVLKCPYTNRIDISRFAEGLYYYKVANGSSSYTGKLLFN